MTERERWIIFPLLFLALATSLKDKLVEPTQPTTLVMKTIECQELRCGKANVGQVVARAAVVEQVRAGKIVIIDAANQPKIVMGTLSAKSPEGDDLQPTAILELYGADGRPAVQLSGGVNGGHVAVAHPSQKFRFLLGNKKIGSGLFVVLQNGQLKPQTFVPKVVVDRLLEEPVKPADPPESHDDKPAETDADTETPEE